MECPVCRHNNIIERPKSYSCECGLIIWKQISGKAISPDIVRQLLETGHTAVLEGFRSQRTGKSFSASLVLSGKKITFEFSDRKSISSDSPKTCRDAIFVRVESGNSGSVSLNISNPVNVTASVNYGLVPSRMAECLGCITAVRLVKHRLPGAKPRINFSLNNLEFSRYILRERTPRNREIRNAVEQLWDLLKEFTWEAQYKQTRRSRLKGSPQADKFPYGIFPWLKVKTQADEKNIYVELPGCPAVTAQFQASIRNFQPSGDGGFSIPSASERALWAWVNTVRGDYVDSKTRESSTQ